LTLLGTLLAAAKTILTNRIQVNNASPLHPLDLLLRMSPLAFLQSIFFAILIGEPTKLTALLSTMPSHAQSTLALKLAINGALAFGLNYGSYAANKKTSPLTMTVAANVKQCLSIILGVWAFNLHVGWMNAAGITALVGGAWYANVEFGMKQWRSDGIGVALSPKDSKKEIVRCRS
jgi:Triose-phosphate Transporter family